MKKIRLAIADDHKLFRKGIIAIFAKYKEIEVVAEAENGRELLDILKDISPDIILLDLNMPVLNGWEVLKELKPHETALNVIILSMYEDEMFIANLIKNGARGFLSKNADPEEIVLAMHSVLQTGYYFNDKTNRALLKKMLMQETIKPLFSSEPIELTEREDAVLRLICDEMNTAEIAEKLFIGYRTVESVRQKLMEKFGAKNSVGLVLSAAKRKFIQL
jgi:DNA-binding NarL/FixJ family response regulator